MMTSHSDQFAGFDSYQARFHQRWGHLRQADVRALAWLLDSPDLFDRESSSWGAHLVKLALPDRWGDWLQQLDSDPAALQVGLLPLMRLGRYAEKLMGYFLQQHAGLVAQGLQVRAGKNETVGEFDFLLAAPGAAQLPSRSLLHWEFATKFYLYDANLKSNGEPDADGYFLGPNLADSLDAKMHKIVHRQLALAQHPAAQAVLPGIVVAARALVKGWLFYQYGYPAPASMGLALDHCRGFWCTLDQLADLPEQHFALLRRLRWLAPASLEPSQTLSKAALIETLLDYFKRDTMPVMLACLQAGPGAATADGLLLEARRGFVVPNDWRERAAKERATREGAAREGAAQEGAAQEGAAVEGAARSTLPPGIVAPSENKVGQGPG